MRNAIPTIVLCAIFCTSLAHAQAVRVDIPLLTSGPNVPSGSQALPQALWVSNASVNFCVHPATTLASCTPVATYMDSTASTECPAATPLVELPGTICAGSAGILGNLGFWYSGGTIDYFVTSTYGTFGPYTVTNGGITNSGIYSLEIGGVVLSAGDTVNWNATLPVAPTNGINCTPATSKSGTTDSVTCATIGDGNATHYLNGTGTYTTPPGVATVPLGTAVTIGARGTGIDTGWANYTMATGLFAELVLNPVPRFRVRFSSIGGTGISIHNCVLLVTARSSSAVLSSTPITFAGGQLPYVTAYSGYSATHPYYLDSDTVFVGIDQQHDYYIYMYFDSDSTNYNTNLSLWGNSSVSSGLAFQRESGNTVPSVSGNIPGFPWMGTSNGSYPGDGNAGGDGATGVPTIVSILAN
jgi:hypothetical protein